MDLEASAPGESVGFPCGYKNGPYMVQAYKDRKDPHGHGALYPRQYRKCFIWCKG